VTAARTSRTLLEPREPREPRAPRILLAESEWVRLRSLAISKLGRAHPAIAALLKARLAAAHVVPDHELPADVASMGARVAYRGVTWVAHGNGAIDEVELVYPWDSAPELGRVSVFSPLGAALLGARVGEVCGWTSPRGRDFEWVLCDVRSKPRAPAPRRLSA
jgi:regulator of nucleoside diphosphate kinase